MTITDGAKKKFLETTAAQGHPGHGLRVTVIDGGTIEPRFALDFVAPEQAAGDDVVIDAGEFRVHIDPRNARFLEGATIDYVETPTQGGFKIDAPNAGVPEPEGPVAEAVQKVLDEKVNPGVASHGGHVSLVAVDDETVYLRFGGGCRGCGMVKATLNEGVEKVLLEEVPQIKRVLDVTDHASGTNPYYPSSR